MAKSVRSRKRKRRTRQTRKQLWLLLPLVLILAAVYFFVPGVSDLFRPAATPVEGELAVSYIDVGQGDSVLVRQGKMSMLIDTGDKSDATADKIRKYLRSKGVEQLDYLVLTHPDADHIGNAPEMIEAFRPVNCIMPNKVVTTKIFERTVDALEAQNVNVIEGKAGVNMAFGEATVKLLAPVKESYTDTNDYSVVLRLTFGEKSFLFTGDAEKRSEADMVDTYGTFELQSDVLKVGHHGSGTSSSTAFINKVSPQIAVISVGNGNKYRHPHAEAVARLEEAGVKIYRTDLVGTVEMNCDGKKITVKTEFPE